MTAWPRGKKRSTRSSRLRSVPWKQRREPAARGGPFVLQQTFIVDTMRRVSGGGSDPVESRISRHRKRQWSDPVSAGSSWLRRRPPRGGNACDIAYKDPPGTFECFILGPRDISYSCYGCPVSFFFSACLMSSFAGAAAISADFSSF